MYTSQDSFYIIFPVRFLDSNMDRLESNSKFVNNLLYLEIQLVTTKYIKQES